MTKLTRMPLIVGFGGFNAAGRSSGHNGYKRMVFESLNTANKAEVVTSLASLMSGIDGGSNVDFNSTQGLDSQQIQALTPQVLNGTLVRRIEANFFPVDKTPVSRNSRVHASEDNPIVLHIASRDLPSPLPFGWTVRSESAGQCEIEIWKDQDVILETEQDMPVQAGGQLPSGFNPGAYYRSTHHPRGLQLSILAASDAVHSMGIDWGTVASSVSPDEVGVYSSSVMSQLDSTGFGGMLRARSKGARVTSKQLALGLNTMPADFVNAYVLGSVGATGGVTGACATFLYNLRAGAEDIKSGRRRVVLVGSSEAPILPEVIDGYSAMSALATDADLRKLFGTQDIDYRKASRPFGENCGFTLGESGQYVVLMDDALALQLGAKIYGAVPGVFVNADGFKKSISAPGPGNYITMGKAVSLAQTLLGEEAVRAKSFVQAHGSSTPHNRVSESKIFDKIAGAFGIESWPLAAVKSYVGHSLGPASGDQMAASLGVFEHGFLPGIKTIDNVSNDVLSDRLSISNKDQDLGAENSLVAFLNSKGFGGNNATAAILSPLVVESMLKKRHGDKEWATYLSHRDSTIEKIASYEAAACKGDLNAIYEFGSNMINEDQIEIAPGQIKIPGFEHAIQLGGCEGYEDLI